jgi:hypothetical protein
MRVKTRKNYKCAQIHTEKIKNARRVHALTVNLHVNTRRVHTVARRVHVEYMQLHAEYTQSTRSCT